MSSGKKYKIKFLCESCYNSPDAECEIYARDLAWLGFTDLEPVKSDKYCTQAKLSAHYDILDSLVEASRFARLKNITVSRNVIKDVFIRKRGMRPRYD